MLIRYKCLLCGNAIESLTESAGRVVECAECGAKSTVPHPKPIPPPTARRASPPAADDLDDDPLAARREQRTAKARRRTQLALLFGGFAATAAVIVVAVLVFQNKQQRRALEVAASEKASKSEPKPAPALIPPTRPKVTPTTRTIPTGPALRDITEVEDGIVLPPRVEPVQPVVGPRKKSPLFDAPLPFEPANAAPPAAPQPPAKAKDAVPPKAENAELAKLAKNLKSRDAKIRLKAIEDAGKLGDGAKAVATELCDLILDANAQCATAALVALETVRPDLYKPLVKVVLDRNEDVKIAGINALAALGEEAKPALRVLHNGLRQNLTGDARSFEYRKTIPSSLYAALKAIGPEDAETVAMLKLIAAPGGVAKILAAIGKEENELVNYHRLVALRNLAVWAGDDVARRKTLVPLVSGGLDNQTTFLQSTQMAGDYGKLAKDLLPRLKQLKLSDTAGVRTAATKAVEAIEADIARKE